MNLTPLQQETLETLILTCDPYKLGAHLGINIDSVNLRLLKLVDLLEIRQQSRCKKYIERKLGE